MEDYKYLTTIPVNLGHWAGPTKPRPGKCPDGYGRMLWHEIAFNFGWLPSNCYAKLAIEFKMSKNEDSGKKIEVVLAYQRAVRDGGRKEEMTIIEGSQIEERTHCPWELYETDYFKLPEDWDKTVLVWLLGRTEEPAVLSVAMWSLTIFEKVLT